MAFVSNMQDDKEQSNQAQGPVAPGGASNTVQLAPTSGIGSVGGSTANNAPTGQAGGQFATLQNYVNANQGQAQPLANKITNDIGQQYNSLQGQNQSTLAGIGNQVKSGYTAQNQDILNQEAANPVSFASNPGNIASFQSQLNDKYAGPTKAENTPEYQTQLANVNTAINQGQAQTGTDVGRQQLLAQHEATPTAGVTGLNSAILAQDPNAQANIENAYQPFSNLVSGLSTGAQGINTQIGQGQTEAQNASNQANQQISGQIGALNTGLTNTANQDITTQNKYNQDLQAYQNKWNPLSTDINSVNEAALAYNKAVGPNLYPGTEAGTPYANPFTSTLNQPISNNIYTPQNVGTADQYAQANAFQSLLGGLNTNLPAPIISGAAPTSVSAPTPFTAPNITANQVFQGAAGTRSVPAQGNSQNLEAYNQFNPTYQNLLAELTKQYGTTAF